MEPSTAEEWKEKYEIADKNLSQLKKLAHKAIADYEDLQRKYDQNQKAYEELKETLQDREAQLQEMQQVLGPAYEEYSELQLKYEIQRECRNKAEEYATKIVKQNKKLKRQSQMLLSQMTTVNINIDDFAGEEDSMAGEVESMIGEEEEQVEHLNKIINELQDELVDLKQKLNSAKELQESAEIEKEEMQHMYQQEHEMALRLQNSLQHHEAQLNQFKRVSVRAYEEYQNLNDRYEKERVLRDEATSYAAKMLGECEAVKRSSAAILSSAASDQRLMKALMDIEDLNRTLEVEREQHRQQVHEFESLLEESKDVQEKEDLQQQLLTAQEQIEELNKQLKEREDFTQKLTKEVSGLEGELSDARERLRNPPLPPPPAPPPLPPSGLFKPFRIFKQKKKEAINAGTKKAQEGQNPRYEEAIKEMMDRIKDGKTLRPVKERRVTDVNLRRQPSLQDNAVTGSAMEDLHKILTANLKKRSHSEGHINVEPVRSEPDESETEFTKMFSKIRGQPPPPRNLSLIKEVIEERDSLSPKSSSDDILPEKSPNKLVTQESTDSVFIEKL